jgi:O-succinylbenzoate synthase
MTNVIDLPVFSAEKLEDMAVEADEQLSKWIEMKLDAGLSPYTILGILSLNQSWLSGQLTDEQLD